VTGPCDGEEWLSHVMRRTLSDMRTKNLTITGFRDRKGHLRYVLSNNELVHPQTVQSLIKRGFLEMTESLEKVNAQGEVTYRLKVQS
jgi:hypothetical protein